MIKGLIDLIQRSNWSQFSFNPFSIIQEFTNFNTFSTLTGTESNILKYSASVLTNLNNYHLLKGIMTQLNLCCWIVCFYFSSFKAEIASYSNSSFKWRFILLSLRLNYSIFNRQVFTHLNLCLAHAIDNFKWVKIIQISQNGGHGFWNLVDWCHILSLVCSKAFNLVWKFKSDNFAELKYINP